MEDELTGLHDAFTSLLEETNHEDLARSLTIEAARDAPPASVFSNAFVAHAFSQAQLYHVVNAVASGQLQKGLPFGGGDDGAGRPRSCTESSSRVTPQKRATSSHRTSRSKSSTQSPRSTLTPTPSRSKSASASSREKSVAHNRSCGGTTTRHGLHHLRDRLNGQRAFVESVSDFKPRIWNALLPKYPRALPLLVLANKQNGEGCLTLDEIKDRLIDACGGDDCTILKRVWTLCPLVATTARVSTKGSCESQHNHRRRHGQVYHNHHIIYPAFRSTHVGMPNKRVAEKSQGRLACGELFTSQILTDTGLPVSQTVMSSRDKELSSSRASKRQKTTHDTPTAAQSAVPVTAAYAAPGTDDNASTESHRQPPALPSSPSLLLSSPSPQLLDIPRPVLEHIFTFVSRVSFFSFAPLGPQDLYEETPSLALTCSVWNEIASGFRSRFRAISTVIKFTSGQESELAAIYKDLEERGVKILELELHMGTPQSRGLFKLKKQLRPLSRLEDLSIDWNRVFKACPSLLRLSLAHLPLDTIHIGKILHAASSHCCGLEALILPVAEVKPDDQPGIILRTTSTLYSALEKWYTHGMKRGLVQLAVAKHHNVEEEDLQARSDEFIGAVARFCPTIEYLDGWKATYSDANGLSCDEMWFCSLDVWKLFCQNCVHIREFNWFTAPFDDDFLKEFALHPKRNLKKLAIAAGGDGVYHPAFSDGSYHRDGGFQFTIESVSGILAVCPELEELHVLLEGFRSQSKLLKKRLNDDFFAAVANQCPKLRKLIVNEVIGTHFEKPLPQVTDAGLLSISRLPQLEHVAFMQTLTSAEGMLSLVDNARCSRRIVLKVGSASAEPHMEYFSVLCELLRVFANRSPKSFQDRQFELELVVHEERKKISKQDALKVKLTELLEQVRKQHPEIAVYFCEWREKLDRVCDDLNKLESVVFVSPVSAAVSESLGFETHWVD